MHEHENVAVDADAAGDVRGELGAEFVGVKLALMGEDNVVARIGGAPHRLLDRTGVMAWRDRHDVEREMSAVARERLRGCAGLAFARRSDKNLHGPRTGRRDGRASAEPADIGRRAFDVGLDAAREP